LLIMGKVSRPLPLVSWTTKQELLCCVSPLRAPGTGLLAVKNERLLILSLASVAFFK
jgi:hypothetical protein